MTEDGNDERPRVIRVPLGCEVGAARARLLHDHAGVALVTDHERLVGVVTIEQLDSAGLPDFAPLASVLDTEVVSIDPATGDLDTLSAYRNAAWASLRRRASGPRRLGGAPVGGKPVGGAPVSGAPVSGPPPPGMPRGARPAG